MALGIVHLAVMARAEPIGEIVLKKISQEEKYCTMGIALKNDSWKGHGYGTAAEKLAIDYVFQNMGMKTVFAYALLNNTKSQHVLEKVGFQEIYTDTIFRYYRYDKGRRN